MEIRYTVLVSGSDDTDRISGKTRRMLITFCNTRQTLEFDLETKRIIKAGN